MFDGSPLDAATQRLIEGRARIEKGWCQRELWNSNGAVCMVGAITKEIGVLFQLDAVFPAACARLRQSLPSPSLGGVPDWNNAPGRTKEEVLAVFDKAIAMAPSS